MLSKKQRHEIRRKLRRAQEDVEWHWRTSQTPEDLNRDIEVFFQLHEASAHDKAEFMTDQMQAFFRSIARVLLAEGLLRLSVFHRDGLDVATNLSFSYRGRYLLYNSGYEPEQREHSPGITAVALSMQDAIAEKAVAFDFLSGDEPYKYQLGASNSYTARATAIKLN
jgi:CelD/BcsL family acetyltransferase involved in cellulose biosynthesis